MRTRVRRLRGDDGWAVVTAIIMMAALLATGLAAAAVVDVQQRQARQEGVRESRFNLAEAVLGAQAFALSRQWPGGTWAGQCSSSGYVAGTPCPDPTRLLAGYSGPEYTGATYSTTVSDNPGPTLDRFYDPAATAGVATWDANGDGRVWVRADARVAGRRRSLVALVQLEKQPITLPAASLIAGRVDTTNNGNKVIIDTRGRAVTASPVLLRCDQAQQSNCMRLNRAKGQLSPDVLEYRGTALPPALDADSVALLEETARASNTYWPNAAGACPTEARLTGAVVYIEDGAPCRAWTSGTANSPARPGLLIVERNGIQFGGNFTYHGIVYAVNASTPPSSADLVSLQGRSTIEGAVLIDGPGGLMAGSDKSNVIYNPNAFADLSAFGDGTVVRSTWRELPGG